MNKGEKHITTSTGSIVENLGENYYYLKTIILNRIEISKLELIHFLSIAASKLITGIIFSLLILIASLLLLIALVLYVASLLGSYIYALIVIAIVTFFIGFFFYKVISPLLGNYIIQQIDNIDHLINETKDGNE